MLDRRASPSFISAAALLCWAVLVALQLGWIPGLRHAWGFNLWAYLPPLAGAVFAAAALLACIGSVRERLATGAQALGGALRRIPRPVLEGVAMVGITLALWAIRERQILGDARVLVLITGSNRGFHFPDVGTTFLMDITVTLGQSMQVGAVESIRAVSCLCGGLFVPLVFRAARELAPTAGRANGVALLLLSGGMLRIFAGHLEVYAPLLAMLALWLWLSIAHLRGRVGWAAPCIALGAAVWLHMAALFLVPSLFALPWLREPARPWRISLARGALHVGLAAIPASVFLLAVLASPPSPELDQVRRTAAQILGLSADPNALRWWVRGWGGAASVGTDVVLLSPAHLKYLANALWLLTPAAIPVLLLLAATRTRSFFATPTARFLCAAALPCSVYACALRPFWGPYDWDLFSITAFSLAALAGHLLAQISAGPVYRHLVVWLVVMQLCFVTLPFLAIGRGPARSAGPFAEEYFDPKLVLPARPPTARLEPWL